MARSSSVLLHQALAVAAILIPAAIFLAAAFENRSDVLREGEGTIQRTAAVLDEHARKVFDTVDLALGRVEDRVGGLTDEEVAADEISAFLRNLKGPLRQAVSIWVSNRDGRVLAGSQNWDARVGIGDRNFFQAHVRGSRETEISPAFVGRATNLASFAVSRARVTGDGRFNGVIHVALSPDYFASVFAEAAPHGDHLAWLFRPDGSVLARDPSDGRIVTFDPESPFMRAVAASPEGGVFKGPSPLGGERGFFAFRRASPFSVYVAFGQPETALLERWYANLRSYGAVAASASLFLLILSLLALRRVRAEQEALRQLAIQSEQRLAAEQRLLQSQKMESIGQLTGGIAHDFNNLLAVVLGNLSLLGKFVRGEGRAEQLLERAIQGAERGAILTQRLLAFARRQELAPQSVDVALLVHGVMDLLRSTIGGGVEIVADMPRAVEPALVDPNQLELALVNLAVNARDAMPEGGRVTISLADARLAEGNRLALPPGDYICLTVADTGHGMDADTLARASEPFFTTKEIGKGTGLALSMVHGLALQSGGAFRLRSAPGQGTQAEIWLPRSEAEADRTAPAPPRQESPPQGGSVLVVDDDELVRQSTAGMLEDLGYSVAQAASAAEALQALGRARFDLLITDVVMPQMSGAALVSRAKAQRPDLPVLVVTGYAERSGELAADAARLNKPFTAAELAAAIAPLIRAGK